MEPSSTSDRLRGAAEFLAALRLERGTAKAIPDALRPRDLDEGYAVQDELLRRLLAAEGGAFAGYKIACTNERVQRLMNTDTPVFGRLLTRRVHQSPVTLPAADFTTRIVESEFAFRLGRDLEVAPAGHTRESVAACVDVLLPAIEIVDHRFAALDRFDAPTLAADNAIHGAWVVGAPVSDWRELDLAAQPVRLLVDDTLVSTGSGAAVLGHPLSALAWLADELARRGRPLLAGEYVTTGLTTAVHDAAPGERVRADFGSLGVVAIDF
jgi:2-keto-4-pentenoate hydratase